MAHFYSAITARFFEDNPAKIFMRQLPDKIHSICNTGLPYAKHNRE